MDRDDKKKNAEALHEELLRARGIILSGVPGDHRGPGFRAAQEGCRDGRAI